MNGLRNWGFKCGWDIRDKKLVILRENPDAAAATRKGQIVHAPELPLPRRYGVKLRKESNTPPGYSLDYA